MNFPSCCARLKGGWTALAFTRATPKGKVRTNGTSSGKQSVKVNAFIGSDNL
jgi:hypothetical protein